MRRLSLIFLLSAVLAAGVLASAPVLAQVNTGLTEVGTTIVLPANDPRQIAARIINVALGLVGIILVVLILYAGFLWMTSGGDAAKVDTAKRYIRNAIIGLIIVLMSWGIARFVIDRLVAATGGTGGTGGPGGGTGGPGGGFGGGGGSQNFTITAITPSGSVSTRKVIVKIVFNQSVAASTAQATGGIIVERVSDGQAVGGTVAVQGRVATWTSAVPCPAPNETRMCLDADTDYRVRIATSLASVGGQNLVCGGFASACEGTFRTGQDVDVTPPQVNITYPANGQGVPANALVDIRADIRDQTGVSYVEFQSGGSVIGNDAPQGSTPSFFSARTQWDTAGLALGSVQTLTATGYDVDSGVATSNPVQVTIRAATCFNGVQDGTETGLDCGGTPTAADYCGACGGSNCSNSNQCASGVCSNGTCVNQPIITSVSPQDGAVGTYVTIRGANFGASGNVTFLGPSGSTGVAAAIPQSCVAAGAAVWTPTQVVVEVPPGAQNGPIRVTNAASSLSDDTNAQPDPAIPDYIVNNTVRPGVCAAVPNAGAPGVSFRLVGKGFGSTAGSVLFGARTLTSSSWIDTETQALIPNVTDGMYPAGVQVGANTSNAVDVRVQSAAAPSGPPEIVSITPNAGPIGTYVTLSGRNFGSATGQVFFRDVATGGEALADTNFPPQCANTFWSDSTIVVKAPPSFTQGGSGALPQGAYAVRVVTARPGTPASNEVNYALNNAAATPGICAVVPSAGPVGTAVDIYGERLTSGPGSITFFQNQNGTVGSWNATQIASVIPAGARSGPLTVTPSSGGLTSNGYLIDVRDCNTSPGMCGNGEECCADGACRVNGSCAASAGSAMFAWRTSTGVIPRAPRVVEECRTGQIPSPSPWNGRPGGDSACVNASVVIRFTTPLEPTTVAASANNVRLYECTGQGADPCVTRTQLPLAAGSPQLQAANASQDYLTLLPQTPFNPSTTYEVVLTTGVQGLGGVGASMAENAARCGAGNAYCFRFRTRGDASPCALGSVGVAPDPYTATAQGPLPVTHSAIPLAQADACTVLQCRSYDWTWSTSDGRATVTNNVDTTQSPAVGACVQTATAQLETGNNPVNILASTAGVTGSADLYIKFIPPRVERFGPNCDEACINAAVWAVFNIDLDPASVNPQNVTVQRCITENCLDVDPPLPIQASDITLTPAAGTTDTRLRQINIFPLGGTPRNTLLLPGRFYKVTLVGGVVGGIRSSSQVPLAGLNDPNGFAWTFRARQGDGLCGIDRIDVTPTEKFETRVGARQGFVANPFSVPDSCDNRGQQLVPVASYAWATSQPQVATFLQNGAIDTGAALPAGCTGRCTFQGAAGRVGQTAQCGNGRVETTDAAYCTGGQTPSGQVCTLLPAGGRGGEECDDGNANANDACNNSCLWNPVPSVVQGGTCGNGQVNAGEDCDRGTACTGSSTATLNGTECATAAIAAQCASSGGTCVPRLFRGCSPTCRNLGASAGNSQCGNGSVGDGEDCDDGNSASGDGCSADCLREGSSRSTYALCGNSQMEPGEECERIGNGAWPAAGCDPNTCLKTGTIPCALPGDAQCCGNGAVETGEQCDDGGIATGDGCNAICRMEGSSPSYAQPSFCANGILELGEQCEAPGPAYAGDPTLPVPGGDGLIDPFQIAQIVGQGTPDTNGRMWSDLSAQVMGQGQSGTAVYGLQCGFTDERSCSADRASYDPTNGLTSVGCCDARPRLGTVFPPNRAGDTVAGRPAASDPFPQGVCRNVLISGSFTVDMDAASLPNNFIVAKRVNGSSCPSGLSDVTVRMEPPATGIRGVVQRVWNWIAGLFGATPVSAQRWCAGDAAGTLTVTPVPGSGTQFFYTLQGALDPRTEYRVRFLGDDSDPANPLADNADPANRKGVRSSTGVVMAADTTDEGALTWHFTTGDDVCEVNQIDVQDLSTENPYFFTRSNERHPFVSMARSIQNGRVTPLSPTTQYAWEWQNWVFSNPNVIGINPPEYPQGTPRTLGVTTKEIYSKDVNGAGELYGRVLITADTANTPSTQGKVVQGSAYLTVNLCENPWPSKLTAPFEDVQGSDDLQRTIFQNGPYFNFAMTYCRDSGATGPNEDLPGLVINPTPVNAADAAQGILRQYLFTFREPALQKDGIGVRVATNPLHLSPMDWYKSKGFTGNPQPLTVDGYQAVRDGRTVYISAVSTNGPDANGNSSDLYSNIYLISYNEGAEEITRRVYDLLLSSLSFNINVQVDSSNACQDLAGSLEVGPDGLPVTCSADWECDRLGDNKRCASFKGKVQRDLVRLANFQTIAQALESSKAQNGRYPSLTDGSYLPAITTSRWPSWNDAFRTALGQDPPEDPVNRFVTCGRCGQSRTACVADADCPNGDVCVAQDGFDPVTCWNESANQFRCPAEGQGSRFTQYRSLAGGAGFELSSSFEVPPPNPQQLSQSWWKPAPQDVVRMCTSGLRGSFCLADADCRVCPSGNCTGVAVPAGACQPAGGTFKYVDACVGETRASTGTCGDGIVNGTEVCELSGPTATRQASCTATGNAAGWKIQRCNACTGYADNASQPGCFAISQCGNGRIDGRCSNDATRACTASSECTSGGSCTILETCDDGAQNGTYGKCNASCTGIGGFCGDGMISPGETCDRGAQNGAYCPPSSSCAIGGQSCNLTCSGVGPYCGDGVVDASEQCDGNRQTRACTGQNASGRACASSDPAFRGDPCTQDSQCGVGGTCLSAIVPYEQYLPCDMTRTSSMCQWMTGAGGALSWSQCRPAIYCGNGQVDSGEQCDDGNTVDGDACTNICTRNVCGDGRLFQGVEECDNGSLNGQGCSVSAEYGATCSSCSNICKFQLTQGGYCGNNIKDAGSSEQCDGTDIDPTVTCRALGYDYLKPGNSALQCTPSCQFGGCAYCGDTPGSGKVAGILVDSLFQQPVPNARVSLFYRGLQIRAVSSDATGYFEFTGLDTSTGCGQYRVVIDSYDDNPLTDSFVESRRGGYQSISIGPFAACNGTSRCTDQDDPGEFNSTVTGSNGIGFAVPSPVDPNNGNIVQINMLPRLGDNEYIVQFWWDPIPGDPNGVQNTINAYRANPSQYLANNLTNYHDLVIRTPFTYEPGTFNRCSLTPNPVAFASDRGDICFDQVNGNFTPQCSSVDYPASGSNNEARFSFAVKGMASCTNKIRAVHSGTCVINGTQTDIGCDNSWECVNPGQVDGGAGATCNTTRPEPSRTGSTKVLEGQEGAYLFCFHPEYTDPNARKSSDCRNFIVPPQSAFITGRGRAYDVIISQYYMFGPGAYGVQVSDWLRSHNAELRLYDRNGLNKRWRYAQLNPAGTAEWPPKWEGSILCPNDPQTGTLQTMANAGVGAGVRGAISYPTDAGWNTSGPPQFRALQQTLAGGINQSWVPFSIDTSSRTVNEWNGNGTKAPGNHHAAYLAFSDLYWTWGINNMGAGWGQCWYHTCNRFTDEQSNQTWPPGNRYLCNDNAGRYSGTPDEPACDQATRQACAAQYGNTRTCATTVNANVRCVQMCDNPGGPDPLCTGSVAGSSGQATVPAYCGGPYSCIATGSGLFR